MPHPPPKKPEVRAARPERTPSVWHPEPVPTPGVGRSTEDPRTPRLSELAARERARQASLLAEVPAVAWLATRLLLDGRPAAGVALRVLAPDGSAYTVRTDASGTAYLAGVTPGDALVSVAEGAWPPPPRPDLTPAYVPDVEEYDA